LNACQLNEPSKKTDSNRAIFCRTRAKWGWRCLLNKKGNLGAATASLLRRTPLPGKHCGKMALSSSNDRSRKNPEFPYAENYAGRVDFRNELPLVNG
jgi:hypothetical protein